MTDKIYFLFVMIDSVYFYYRKNSVTLNLIQQVNYENIFKNSRRPKTMIMNKRIRIADSIKPINIVKNNVIIMKIVIEIVL